jgi:hypothetical protein
MPRLGQRKYQPGDIVGDWTVLEFSDRGKYKYYWRCRCKCGTVKDVQQTHLGSGKSTKCSKCSNHGVSNGRYSHGMANTRVYKIWADMIGRCNRPSNSAYADYGGRGITVCDSWVNSFESFYADMGDPPTPKHSIDRREVNGDYEPSNCRWATMTEQARNRRNNKILTYEGQSLCLTEWSEKTGISFAALQSRIDRGWSVKESLTIPHGHTRHPSELDSCVVHNLGRLIEHNGMKLNLSGWSEVTGLSRSCIRNRLRKGWTVNDALTVRSKKWRHNLTTT